MPLSSRLPLVFHLDLGFTMLILLTALSISSEVKGPLFMSNSQCTILDIYSFSVILGHLQKSLKMFVP